jgi:HEAT repeat protein
MGFLDGFFDPDIEGMETRKDTEGLIRALGYQKKAMVRAKAAEALGRLKAPGSVKPLIAALKDPEWDVREKVAEALGNIADPGSVEPLIACLEQTGSYSAATALGRIGDPRAAVPLRTALKNESEFDHPEIIIEAMRALMDLEGLDNALAPLIDREREVLKYSYAEGGNKIKFNALEKIARYDTLYAAKVLAGLSTATGAEVKDPEVKEEATRLLDTLRSPGAAEIILQVVYRETGDHSSFGNPTEKWIHYLKNRYTCVRLHSIRMLLELGTPDAIEGLRSAKKTQNKEVRREIIRALERLEADDATPKDQQPKFVRKYSEKRTLGNNTYEMYYEIYKGINAESARNLLFTKRVDKKNYYIIVETPEGNWGLDVEGLFLEHLLPWQTNLSSVECEGTFIGMSWSSFSLDMAARGNNENFILKVQCGKCQHQWYDGVRYQSITAVRCPKCKTLNKIDSSLIKVYFV